MVLCGDSPWVLVPMLHSGTISREDEVLLQKKKSAIFGKVLVGTKHIPAFACAPCLWPRAISHAIARVGTPVHGYLPPHTLARVMIADLSFYYRDI